MDLAWDGVSFTPGDVNSAIEENNIRTLARRHSLVFTTSKYEERDNGDIGTSSCQLGSRHSIRMLRVYDKRGPTRIEFQARDERAHQIARQLAGKHVDSWSKVAKSHLRDYIDFVAQETGDFLHWWLEFIANVERANTKVNKAREMELERIFVWLQSQAAPSLSVLVDVYGFQTIQDLIKEGRIKRGNRFKSILELQAKKGKEHEKRI